MSKKLIDKLIEILKYGYLGCEKTSSGDWIFEFLAHKINYTVSSTDLEVVIDEVFENI